MSLGIWDYQGLESTTAMRTKDTTCTDMEGENAYDVFGIPYIHDLLLAGMTFVTEHLLLFCVAFHGSKMWSHWSGQLLLYETPKVKGILFMLIVSFVWISRFSYSQQV